MVRPDSGRPLAWGNRRMMFGFADVVIVEGNLVGVVVKCWETLVGNRGNHYDVYVRMFNVIREYDEHQVTRFIYDKELSEESLSYYS